MYKNWLAKRGEQFRSGIQLMTLDPFHGQHTRHRLPTPRRHQRLQCLPRRQTRRQSPSDVHRRNRH